MFKRYCALAVALCSILVSSSAFADVSVFVIGDDRPDEVGPTMTPETDWITYTAWDGSTIPSAADLQQYDVVLIYATAYFPEATQIGDAVAEYYENGGSILTATGYMSNRSDGRFTDGAGDPNSWGDLEQFDTMRGFPGGIALEYPDPPADYTFEEIADHPLTETITSVGVDRAKGRGNVSTKPNTTVLARWANNNYFTTIDPAIGVREDGFSRSVGVSISPLVTLDGAEGTDWTGDLHAVWRSAIAWAAADFEIALVSNQRNGQIAEIFYGEMSGLFFRGRGISALPTDLAKFDAILFFTGALPPNTHELGNTVATYYEGGGGFVHSTFYLQDRSDGPFGADWGRLENYDAFLSAGGSEDDEDTMDPDSVVDHPVTAGVNMLFADLHRGGAALKPTSTMLAAWSTPNPDGGVDPLVAIRDDGDSRVVGLSIAAHYEWIVQNASRPTEYTGDLHPLVENSLKWAAARCGDGRIDAGEVCDDGNRDEGDGCSPGCELESCGDGVTQDGEECDDGNADNEDGCLDTCQLASCGDGFVQVGEECDDGGQNSDTDPDSCRTDCTDPFCGDGVTDSDEGCDDGDANGGFSCRIDCVLPTCGDGVVDPGEDCDLGDDNSNSEPDTCRENCLDFYCGDGVVDFNEECDLGREQNGADGSICSRACVSRDGTDPGADMGGGPDTGTDDAEVTGTGSEGCCAQVPTRGEATPLAIVVLLGALTLRRRRRAA